MLTAVGLGQAPSEWMSTVITASLMAAWTAATMVLVSAPVPTWPASAVIAAD